MIKIILPKRQKEPLSKIWPEVSHHLLCALQCLLWNTNVINRPLIGLWIHTRCFCLLAPDIEHGFVPVSWGFCCIAEALLFCFPKRDQFWTSFICIHSLSFPSASLSAEPKQTVPSKVLL